jgi:hypothetical protein
MLPSACQSKSARPIPKEGVMTRTSRIRTLLAAAAMAGLTTLATVGAALAGGGTSPFPK